MVCMLHQNPKHKTIQNICTHNTQQFLAQQTNQTMSTILPTDSNNPSSITHSHSSDAEANPSLVSQPTKLVITTEDNNDQSNIIETSPSKESQKASIPGRLVNYGNKASNARYSARK